MRNALGLSTHTASVMVLLAVKIDSKCPTQTAGTYNKDLTNILKKE